MAYLTGINETVTVGGRETTILAELRKQQTNGGPSVPNFRAYVGNGIESPSDTYHVTLRNEAGDIANFEVSEATFKSIRGASYV